MAKSNRNSEKAWTASETNALQSLASGNTLTRVIGLKLGGTEGAIYTKASQESVSLKPTKKSPYGTKGKR
jgi:hypothetical protein